MGGTCSAHGKFEKGTQEFSRKTYSVEIICDALAYIGENY